MRRLFLLVLVALGLTAVSAAGSTPTLVDWGGPIAASPTVHVLWWGWDDNPTVDGFNAAFVGSNYAHIADEYLRGGMVGATYSDATSYVGSTPGHAPRASAVRSALIAAYGTLDPNGLYVVYGSTYGNWSVGACGWHDYVTYQNQRIPIVYIPNDWASDTPQAVAACRTSPFFFGGAWSYEQGAANLTAHEVMEAITDPEPCTAMISCVDGHGDVAWDTVDGTAGNGGGLGEIADLCVWQWGVVTMTDGSQWHLQGEWSNRASACVWSS